jgi:hypothetical protein
MTLGQEILVASEAAPGLLRSRPDQALGQMLTEVAAPTDETMARGT